MVDPPPIACARFACTGQNPSREREERRPGGRRARPSTLAGARRAASGHDRGPVSEAPRAAPPAARGVAPAAPGTARPSAARARRPRRKPPPRRAVAHAAAAEPPARAAARVEHERPARPRRAAHVDAAAREQLVGVERAGQPQARHVGVAAQAQRLLAEVEREAARAQAAAARREPATARPAAATSCASSTVSSAANSARPRRPPTPGAERKSLSERGGSGSGGSWKDLPAHGRPTGRPATKRRSAVRRAAGEVAVERVVADAADRDERRVRQLGRRRARVLERRARVEPAAEQQRRHVGQRAR